MNHEQRVECEQMSDKESMISEILSRLPKPLQGDLIEQGSNRRLCLKMPDGKVQFFIFNLTTQPRKAWLMDWKVFSENLNEIEPFILLCEYLSPNMQKYCIDNEINFIDAAGNVFILTHNYYINVSGKKNSELKKKPQRISIGVMKLLFVLLADKDAINYTYRDIAELAGISLGMVAKGFDYLENKSLCRKGINGRRFTNLPELYSIWIQSYDSVLRTNLKKMTLMGDLSWKEMSLLQGECWAGEVAGYELSRGYLQPERIKIFTAYPFHERRKDFGLHPSSAGHYEFIEAFWSNDFHMTLTGYALLTIAELIASQDDRNIETARIINEQYLHISTAVI